MKNILYIGNFSFPLGNAAGKRVYANGKLLRKLGYKVIFIGVDKEIQSNLKLIDTKSKYDGFEYYNFSYPKSKLDWANFNCLFDKLCDLFENENLILELDLLIYYGSPTISLFITKLIKYCKKNNIKIISDCVDWLTVKTNNPIFNIIKWADNTYQKSILNKRVDGVITISKFLERYYKKAGMKTVVIPPLSPRNHECLKLSKHNHKVIVYAGVPFRKGQIIKNLSTLKDRIDTTIELLYKAKQNDAKFVFNVFGFTKEEYLEVIPSQLKYIDSLKDSIIFHGIKPNEEVIKEIEKADFTILIRDINRDTSAGFPTKVSESISCGTPVITTKTSDLEDYIFEGENGYFLNTQDKSTMVNQIMKILTLDKKEINFMKKNCYESNLFDYSNFIHSMEGFLIDLNMNGKKGKCI